jgi:hypothetical protein
MTKEELLKEIDSALPNKLGLQLQIFSWCEKYAQSEKYNLSDTDVKMLEDVKESLGDLANLADGYSQVGNNFNDFLKRYLG